MRWSVPIGRVFGIMVRLHVTFLMLLVAFGVAGYADSGMAGAGWSLALMCSMFTCVVIHELGHSVVAQKLGVPVSSITLLPIGGVAALRKLPEQPWHEIAITVAGPMMNALIAAVLLPFTGLPGHLLLQEVPVSLAGLLIALVQVNLTLFLFNFIPAFPMDGGRLLRASLALVCSYERATAIAAAVGQLLAVGFVMMGLSGQVWLVVIGVFIYVVAESEARLVRTRGVLRDVAVGQVMCRDAAVVAPGDKLSDVMEKVYRTGQDDFPVMDDGWLMGMLNRADMIEVMNKRGGDVPVAEVMEPVTVVSSTMNLTDVYDQMLGEGATSAPVMDDGKLVGLLGMDNINRYVRLQSSLKLRWLTRRSAALQTPAPPPLIVVAPPTATPPPREESAPPTAPA